MDVIGSISLSLPNLSRSSFLRGHNIVGKLRGDHQGKSVKHMVLRGGERPGASWSISTAEDDALSIISFQDGIFLSQGLLTHGHSAHRYLKRQHITHGQHHPSQLNHFLHLRQESLEGFSRTSSHAPLSQELHLLSTAGSVGRANQAVEKSRMPCTSPPHSAQATLPGDTDFRMMQPGSFNRELKPGENCMCNQKSDQFCTCCRKQAPHCKDTFTKKSLQLFSSPMDSANAYAHKFTPGLRSHTGGQYVQLNITWPAKGHNPQTS